MEGQEQQQVDIYALVDAYKDLLDTKEELKELTTENNKAIMAARDALAKAMIDAESPRISRAGFVYSLGEKTEYSKRGCNEEEFFDFLRSIGLGDIIKPTVNARTLNSSMKETIGMLREEFAKKSKARMDIQREVKEAIRAAHLAAYEQEERAKLYNRYLYLANGSETVAASFYIEHFGGGTIPPEIIEEAKRIREHEQAARPTQEETEE